MLLRKIGFSGMQEMTPNTTRGIHSTTTLNGVVACIVNRRYLRKRNGMVMKILRKKGGEKIDSCHKSRKQIPKCFSPEHTAKIANYLRTWKYLQKLKF